MTVLLAGLSTDGWPPLAKFVFGVLLLAAAAWLWLGTPGGDPADDEPKP